MLRMVNREKVCVCVCVREKKQFPQFWERVSKPGLWVSLDFCFCLRHNILSQGSHTLPRQQKNDSEVTNWVRSLVWPGMPCVTLQRVTSRHMAINWTCLCITAVTCRSVPLLSLHTLRPSHYIVSTESPPLSGLWGHVLSKGDTTQTL